MRKLGLTILAAVLCIAAAFPLQAQGNPQPQGQRRGFNMGAMLMQGITLTAAQQAKVDSISMAFQAEMRQVRDSVQAAGGDMSGMRAQMQDRREKHLAEYRAVLTTEDQREKFDKNVEQMRNRRGTGRPPGRN